MGIAPLFSHNLAVRVKVKERSIRTENVAVVFAQLADRRRGAVRNARRLTLRTRRGGIPWTSEHGRDGIPDAVDPIAQERARARAGRGAGTARCRDADDARRLPGDPKGVRLAEPEPRTPDGADAVPRTPPLRARDHVAGVLFDVDGTLVDSVDAHARAWVAVLEEFGYEVEYERMRGLIGMGGDKVLPFAVGVNKDTDEGRRIFGATPRNLL